VVIVALSSWASAEHTARAYVARVWSNEAAARAHPPRPHLFYGTSTRRPRKAHARRGLM